MASFTNMLHEVRIPVINVSELSRAGATYKGRPLTPELFRSLSEREQKLIGDLFQHAGQGVIVYDNDKTCTAGI